LKKPADMQILIVGLGQIGGSIGLRLMKNRTYGRIIGFDKDKKQALVALKGKGVHRIIPRLENGISQADLIILAIPPRAIISFLPLIAGSIPRNSAVFDVGSTKVEIMKTANKYLRGLNFIGGHPLAGTEGSGFKSAHPDLFHGATFALLPSQGISGPWVKRIKSLVISLGARPLFMQTKQHDRLLALTSGLPYAICLSLMNLAITASEQNPEIWKLVAGSFRSATRVASSSPSLTTDILITNRRHLIKAIDQLSRELSRQKRAILLGDENYLKNLAMTTSSMAKKINHG